MRQGTRAGIFLCIALSGVTLWALAEPVGSDRQSSYALMSVQTQAMQDDPAQNPATFWLLDGQTLWQTPAGKSNKSCATCHGDAEQSMKGVWASYPKVLDGKLINVEGRINQCRTQHQQALPFPHESKAQLSIAAYVGTQSKGMPITVSDLAPAEKKYIQAGRQIFEQRMGQLNLSCAQCHAERSGLKLAGNVIPQAHPTGYPIYRLEWQTVGSLERRLRNCMSGVRAEPFAFDSQEIVDLELYLMWRARGMPLETPAVRP